MSNLLVLTNVAMALLDRHAAIQAVVGKAQAEGRDVSEAELNSLLDADTLARLALQAAIDRARADRSGGSI